MRFGGVFGGGTGEGLAVGGGSLTGAGAGCLAQSSMTSEMRWLSCCFAICQLRRVSFSADDLVVVLLDALGVVSGDAVHFRLDLGVLLGFAGLEFFELFLLAGFVGVEGLLAVSGVLEQIVGRGSGGVEGHEHGGALDVLARVRGCGRC